MNYPIPFIEYCETLPLKLTSLRRAVLYLLWDAKKPIKAYEILDDLLKIKPNATPPTVYRALVFFVAMGILHKIESIQSYVLCSEPEKRLPMEVLMVCHVCHQMIEKYDELVQIVITKLANEHYFQLKQDAIELKGTCHSCA